MSLRDITCSSMGLTYVFTCLTCLYFSGTFGIVQLLFYFLRYTWFGVSCYC